MAVVAVGLPVAAGAAEWASEGSLSSYLLILNLIIDNVHVLLH